MPTDAELDAAATELRGTLEVMLSHADDTIAATTGAAQSKTLWRARKRPAPACWICKEPIQGYYVTGRVAHWPCMDRQEARRRWQD